jgi:hypothetical protein
MLLEQITELLFIAPGRELISLLEESSNILTWLLGFGAAMLAGAGVWRRSRRRESFLLASFLLLLASQIVAGAGFLAPYSVWIAGLGIVQMLAVSAAVPLSGSGTSDRRLISRSWTIAILLVLILCGVLIRTWQLSEFPRPVGAEFAQSGMLALEALESGRSFLWRTITGDGYQFLVFMKGPVFLMVDLWAALFWLFGPSFTVMKLLPSLFGICSVFAVWRFGKRWLGPGTGAAAAFFFAVSPYMIGISRNIWAHFAFTILYSLLALHVTLYFAEKPNRKRALLFSLVVLLSPFLYRVVYIILPVALLFVLKKCVTDREFRRAALKSLAWTAPVFCLVFAVLAFYCTTEDFFGHVMNYTKLRRIAGQPQHYFLSNLQHTLEKLLYLGQRHMFAGVGQWGERAGSSGYVHIPFVFALFIVGLGVALRRLRRSEVAQLLAVWMIFAVLTGFSSVEFFARRLLMVEPVFFLLAGMGAVQLFKAMPAAWCDARRAAAVTGVAVFLLSCFGHGRYSLEVERFKVLREQQEARYVASALEDDIVFSLHDDIGSMRNRIYILAWDHHKMHEVRARWDKLGTPARLEAAELPNMEFDFVQLIVRPDYKHRPPLLRMLGRFEDAREKFPTWSLEVHKDQHAPHRPLFVALRVPRSQFVEARQFALNNFFALRE